MYLTHDQVILVLNQSKRQPDDSPVFALMRGSEEVFTTDATATGAQRYGTLYWDTRENPCIVPDTTPSFGLTTFRNIVD